MATSTDLNWEENLISHWMSNAARAGVILNPTVPGLKTTRAISTESVSSDHGINLVYRSSSISPSENTMHKVQILDPKSSFEEKVNSSKILFSTSASNKEQTSMVKDVPAQLTSTETKPGSDQLDDLDEGCCTELLLQKLEQLKELQHHKKELLRRQQMEQIQRLMEEQQNLLSLVAEQQEHTGSPATKDEGTQNYAGSVCLSPIPYFPLCHSRGNTDWDSTSHISSPVEQRDFLQNFNNNQILKKNQSADPFYKNQSLDISLKGNNELKVEDQNIISGRTKQSPEQSLQGSIEGDSDCEDQRNVEVSKNPTAGKCSEAVNAEERPIATCLQERKQTFEEFLEEQIRLEEQRLNEKANLKVVEKAAFQKPVSKQPFLKRGEGLNRYTNAKYKVAKQKESKTILQPDPLEIKNTLKTDKLQLHRKTASSNKISDSFVPKPVHQNIKTKKNLSFPARKTTGLRNCTGKGISSSTRQNSNEVKPEVLRNSLRSEINGEKEKNKENVMPLAKLHETDVKLPAGKEALSEVTEFLINPCEKDQELSFELSFQKKLGNWEAEKEKEKNELDEFLFLEQAADEVSFASNSSLIIRILDQGQQISSGHRLSSTPIKSRLQEKQINVLNVTAAGNINGRNGVSQGSNHERHQDGSQAPEPFMVHRSSADYEALQTSSSAEFQDTKNTELDEDKSDESSEMTSESEEEFEITIKPANEGADKITLKKQSGCPEFSECKEPMESTESAKSPDSMEKDGGQSNQLYRDTAYPSVFCNDRNKFQFDDEISWSDFENSNLCSNMVSKVHLTPDCSKTPFPDKVIKRKIAMVKKGDALLKQNMAVNEETEPPTSDLMLKLFPSLKPKQKVDAQSRHESKSNMTQEESSGESVRSQLLKEKLVELEMEIERFRTENASLSKLREEHETALEKLRKEKSDYEHHKTQQLAQIEELKKEEARKLQKERKVFEKYAQAARAIPDKKERDEIQALKQQIATLQEDVKKRETKWSATHTRLRDQIEALMKENTQLREEIKIMERFRLEAWKRKEAPTKKKKNSNSGYSDKNESTHLPALPKSHSGSSMNQIEKSSKINVKSDLPSEESLSPKCEPAKAYEADLDKKIKPEDSSQTFMANFPADGTVESSSAVTFDSSESEEEVEREASHPDGKVEKVLKNGCHLIIFPNGTRKEVSYDGKTTTVTFFNGDVKQVLEDQRVIYYYADAKTIHTTYPTGLEVLHFSNGQIEKHFPDGKKEITFPDQTIKNVFTDGREVNIFPDGTIVHMQQDGSKIIEFSNGQQEVHTADFKRREYPDGTIKTVYADGHQETQYASGRLRVKNKNGDVVMDTHP